MSKEKVFCKECNSNNLLLTVDGKYTILGITCLDCGWLYETKEFKKLTKSIDDCIKNFDRDEILMTKKKRVVK